jgi:hypothetical protein
MITTIKSYNANQHYEMHRVHKYVKLGDEWKCILMKLKSQKVGNNKLLSDLHKNKVIKPPKQLTK